MNCATRFLLTCSLILTSLGICAQNFPTAENTPAAFPIGATNKPHVSAQIIANRDAAVALSDYKVALRLTHEQGWHTYWKFAGDTGYPTTVTWDIPKEWSIRSLGVPIPEKFTTGNITNFGYHGEVIFPYALTIPRNSADQTIRAKVEWLACKDVCIPGETTVSFRVPVRVENTPSEHAGAIDEAIKAIPEVVPTPTSMRATYEDSRIRIDLAPEAGRIDRSLSFIPTQGETVDLAFHSIFSQDGGKNSLYLMADEQFKPEGATLPGVLIADGGPRTGGWIIETQIPVQKGVVKFPSEAEEAAVSVKKRRSHAVGNFTRKILSIDTSLSTRSAFLFAFVGGLLLNLMPCVFPVLSLKILHLVQGAQSGERILRHGIAFSAGILLSMLILAGSLLALRAFGSALGWGFQLQSPVIVTLLVLLFVSIGLNLCGLFEFASAARIADIKALRERQTHSPSGSFWTGVLTVVVASPCTAPFMGAALGYAVTQHALVAILIFLTLGLGLCLPWLVLTLFPSWTRHLPRPGMWMERLKKFLALPMFAAALWLIWVLDKQINAAGLMAVGFSVCVMTIFLWCVGREQFSKPHSRVLKFFSGLLAVAGVCAIGLGTFDSRSTLLHQGWTPWSETAVETALQQGHPVFVDFTASWCVTCQYNKQAAIETQAAREAFERLGYVRLLADWTNRDESISKVLLSFGRTGVPLYLVYSRDGSVAVLPEILTEHAVLKAIEDGATKR